MRPPLRRFAQALPGLFVGAFAVLSASSAFGHTGHGVTESNSLVHYVIEPVHAVPVVLLLAGVAIGWVALRRRSR